MTARVLTEDAKRIKKVIKNVIYYRKLFILYVVFFVIVNSSNGMRSF